MRHRSNVRGALEQPQLQLQLMKLNVAYVFWQTSGLVRADTRDARTAGSAYATICFATTSKTALSEPTKMTLSAVSKNCTTLLQPWSSRHNYWGILLSLCQILIENPIRVWTLALACVCGPRYRRLYVLQIKSSNSIYLPAQKTMRNVKPIT